MTLHLFGATTPCGEALIQAAAQSKNELRVQPYSRTDPEFAYINFHDPGGFEPKQVSDTNTWISFAPIWLLATFLEKLKSENPEALQGINQIIACSSSSATTKRFAANNFDKTLSFNLRASEEQLINTSKLLNISCTIIRPTLIYGSAGPYSDKNINRLRSIVRRLPFLILPKNSGLRQPIHARQVANLVLQKAADHSACRTWSSSILEIGGDEIFSYKAMIEKIQATMPQSDRCPIFEIPNRVFNFCASPLIILSPKLFEAILRISADLSGFKPAHELLEEKPKTFPVRNINYQAQVD